MAIRSYLVGCGGVNGWNFLFNGNDTRYKLLMVSVCVCVCVSVCMCVCVCV